MKTRSEVIQERNSSLQLLTEELTRIMKTGKPLVVQERRTANTAVVTLEDVGVRFARGKVECKVGEEITYFPYTINYSDVLTDAILLRGVDVS